MPFRRPRCATAATSASRPGPARQPLPGADRDAHGCIGSAGYAWCARENACVRPWELLRRKGKEPDEAEFRAWCSATRR